MNEESNNTINRIEKLCQKYEETAKTLSKPVAFITKPFENQLNSEVSIVFKQASKILRRTIDISSDDSNFSTPEIASLNGQLKDLNEQLDNRSNAFYESLKSAKKVITSKINNLESEYQNKTDMIISDNENQKSEIEKEIQNIQDSFNSKLKEELSPHLKEQSEIQSKLMKLKSDYEKTNQNLITSVRSAKEKIKDFERQKEDYQDETTVEKMQEDLNNMEINYQDQIKQKKEEQKMLNEDLNSIQSYYNSEETRLQDLLTQIETSSNENIKKSLDAQNANHQQMKAKLENEYKRKEFELKRLIDKEEQTNSVSVEKLQSEIDEQKKLYKDAHDRYKNALHELESKINTQLAERELEKQNIEKIQAKTLKQMANRHREQLAAIKKENELARSSLEQKLQNAQRSPQPPKKSNASNLSNVKPDNISSKPVYQPSLPSTTLPGNKTAPRRRYAQKANSITQKPPQPISRPFITETGSVNSEYDTEISDLMNKFNFASKMETETFQRAVDSVQKKSIYSTEISRLGISRAKRHLEQLQIEKENLSSRLKLLSEKSATDSQNESEAKLHSRISAQYNVIMDLKNSIQKLKNEKSSKLDLSTIQAEHRKELEKMRSRLTTLENSNRKKVQQVRESYVKKIQNEVEMREKTLNEINQKIEDLTEEIKKTKEIINDGSIKEHQEWMRIRKEVSDSTHRINSNDGEASRNTGSVQMLPVEPKSFLPLLKH
ncbi:hypothetical protein M9Y10_021730 [Tritrichomonas musculus]|uniref:Uncharacterized protein n=1 Tax=Tritrichomonas musculus TaxID=1915356 RepID=A0ABR2KR57_9EUKA